MMKRTLKKSKTDDLEDVKNLQKIAKAASDKALRISSVMGYSVTIIRNNEIIEILPNGEERFIKKHEVMPLKLKELKKGSVLWPKKQF